MSNLSFNPEDAENFFKFLAHEKFTEIRIISLTEGIKGDFFVDNLADFLRICEKHNGQANVYVGVNERAEKQGKAEYVSKFCIIPIDIDPIRPKGHASTDFELNLARQKMEQIKNWLKEEFDCVPFISMSGNGYHLYIKIPSISVDEFNRDAVQEKLKIFVHEIQSKFNGEQVHIDSTFDLPRVMKCPGTLSVKGDNTPERPWRMCEIIEANDKPCARVRDHLAKTKVESAKAEFEFGTKTKEDFDALLQKDDKLKDLYEGRWKEHGFPSRSEAEQSLLTKLIFYGFSEGSIHAIMSQSKIGKWHEKTDAYHRMSINKAVEFVKEHKQPYEGKTENFETCETCGLDAGDYIYEQFGNKFLMWSKKEGKVVERVESFTLDGKTFEVGKNLPFKIPSDCTMYESVETLWNEVRQFIYDHLDLTNETEYDILSAWTLASWVPEIWTSIPYLFFHGTKGSGKTRCLEIFEQLSLRGWLVIGVTAPNLFRTIDAFQPTIFLDEAEIYTSKYHGDLIAMLNSGYRRGATVPRLTEPNRKTGKRTMEWFKVFGFKGFASTKILKETLMDRCLIITITKNVRDVRRKIDFEKAQELRNKLLMWRFQMLTNPPKLFESELDGRLAELFEPLISVAPEEFSQKIVDYAKNIKESRKEEEYMGLEATVFNVILRSYEQSDKSGQILMQAVTDEVNRGLDWMSKGYIRPEEVGWVVKRLGFAKKKRREGTFIIWNEEVAKRLKKRYCLTV